MVSKKIDEIYENRGQRAGELKRQGRRIIGYFCSHTPPEIITAAGAVPYRMQGSVEEPITLADSQIETIVCPYVRSCLELVLKGKYEFLDGLVMADTCDNIAVSFNIFRSCSKLGFSDYLTVPHVLNPSAYEFYKGEIRHFSKQIAAFTGQEITSQALRQAIDLHNENRGLVRKLYDLRKADPPLISGSEITRLLVAGVSIPADEFNRLLKQFITEAAARRPKKGTIRPRLMVSSTELDDDAFIQLVEECGAEVVIDDMCIGTKNYWSDIAHTADPYEGLANYYLDKITCPRTLRDNLDDRFGHVTTLARDFNAAGVICYTIRYCDAKLFDYPDMRDYLQSNGLPSMNIEDDYRLSHKEGIKTRIQAFLEVIST